MPPPKCRSLPEPTSQPNLLRTLGRLKVTKVKGTCPAAGPRTSKDRRGGPGWQGKRRGPKCRPTVARHPQLISMYFPALGAMVRWMELLKTSFHMRGLAVCVCHMAQPHTCDVCVTRAGHATGAVRVRKSEHRGFQRETARGNAHVTWDHTPSKVAPTHKRANRHHKARSTLAAWPPHRT